MNRERRARAFAEKHHADQKYGDKPYITHLEAVVEILRSTSSDELICAGWLHDVIEDAQVAVSDVASVVGEEVALLVWAVTGVGKNRKERNASMYRKIRDYPTEDAATLKLADRLANVRASRVTRTTDDAGNAIVLGDPAKFSMYLKEWLEFRVQLNARGSAHLWKAIEQEFA